MGRSTLVGRLLVSSVIEHDWTIPLGDAAEMATRVDPVALARAARFHGLTGCVFRSLGSIGTTGRAGTLCSDHRNAIERHTRTLGDVARLAPLLDDLGVRWLVVKGPVLAEAFYAQPDLRSYNDLDVVVPGHAFGRVLTRVERTGGTLIDRNWPLLHDRRVGEVLMRLRHGTLLDLHWHVLNDPDVRMAFRIPMAEMMERARRVQLGPVRALTLDPTDTLLHLGLHGCLSGGNRLVWLKDVERAIATDPPRWDDVVQRARAWGIGPPVALILARAGALLGAAVPDGLPQALGQGRTWSALADIARRVSPPERSTGSRSATRLVARSTRHDTRASAAELGRHVVKGLAGPGRFSSTPRRPDTDPRSALSARHACGTDVDRQAFLDGVVTESS